MKNKNVSPEKILSLNWDYTKTRVLASAVELNIFTHIANGKKTANAVSRSAKISLRGASMLLNALAGLGLLIKNKNESFSLSRDSAAFLVQGKERYLGDMSLHSSELSKIWEHLTECIKSGKPFSSLTSEKGASDYFPRLVRALFKMNYPGAAYAAEELKRKHKDISKVLDVASGSGVWGIAFAERFPFATVTAVDFPQVIKITREYAEGFGVGPRYEYSSGDLRVMDFGKERYDLVILGHICHSEGKIHTKELFKKTFHALKKGGRLLVAEFLLNNGKKGPLIPLLFALNMLVNTDEGDVFAIGEIKEWLSGTGFKKIKVMDKAPSLSPLILAVKE